MSQGPGGPKFAKFVTLAQFYYLSIFSCFIILDSLSLTLSQIFKKKLDKGLKTFSPFQGVMKIRIAVTLVVLGLLKYIHPTIHTTT